MTVDPRAMLSSWASSETILSWAFRSSFVEYVNSIDDGRIHTEHVAVGPESRFLFTSIQSEVPSSLAYQGSVHFWAHLGVMDFHLKGLRLHLDNEPRITIAAQPRESKRATIAELVDFKLAGSAVIVGASLTEDGVRLLGGVYSVGAPLDPLRFERLSNSGR